MNQFKSSGEMRLLDCLKSVLFVDICNGVTSRF